RPGPSRRPPPWASADGIVEGRRNPSAEDRATESLGDRAAAEHRPDVGAPHSGRGPLIESLENQAARLVKSVDDRTLTVGRTLMVRPTPLLELTSGEARVAKTTVGPSPTEFVGRTYRWLKLFFTFCVRWVLPGTERWLASGQDSDLGDWSCLRVQEL